jgi:hypothetical protein
MNLLTTLMPLVGVTARAKLPVSLSPEHNAFPHWHKLFLAADSVGGPIEQDKSASGR